jgi:hypothetical protein
MLSMISLDCRKKLLTESLQGKYSGGRNPCSPDAAIIMRYHSGTVLKILLFALLATSLSGCIVSFSNPLSTSQQLDSDDRLLGKWEGKDEQNNLVSAVFSSQSKTETRVSVAGLLGREPIFRMVHTKISDNDYIILRLDGDSRADDYIVARYTLDNERLSVCLLNADKIKQAINDKKLKGKVDYSQWGGAVITEKPKAVVEFLGSPNSKNLFNCLPTLSRVQTN